MNKNDGGNGPSIDEQARDWVLRLDSGDIERSDLEACKAWLASDARHRAAFERRRVLWQDLSMRPEIFSSPRAPRRSGRPRRIGRWLAARPRRTAGAAIAASLAAFFMIPQAMFWAAADYSSSAEILNVKLPDGSIATLDGASAISVDFGDGERRISLLRGNAFFDVRHGDPRPFRVAAGAGVTEDIGTRFEVRHAPDRTAVNVAQGAVRVSATAASASGLRLNAGESANYEGNGHVVKGRAVIAADVAAWRTGELLIDGASMGDAIAAVSRYRKGPTWVWADLSGTASVSGAFRTDRADDALKALVSEAGLGIRWLPGGVAIITAQRPF